MYCCKCEWKAFLRWIGSHVRWYDGWWKRGGGGERCCKKRFSSQKSHYGTSRFLHCDGKMPTTSHCMYTWSCHWWCHWSLLCCWYPNVYERCMVLYQGSRYRSRSWCRNVATSTSRHGKHVISKRVSIHSTSFQERWSEACWFCESSLWK